MREIFLENMAKQNGWQRGAEVGVWYGRTFFHLLDNVPGLFLYGVDVWCYGPEPSHHKDQDENKKSVIFRALHYQDRADILVLPSVDAAKCIPDGDLDFVFIDADHTFDGVLADIKAWLPKVKSGGYLTGHDWDWPSVRDAVRMLLPDAIPGTESNDFVWIWRKP